MPTYTCDYCRLPIDPASPGVHAKMLGWCPLTKTGKAGAPVLAERVGGFAHRTCIDEAQMKSRGQETSLF
jgi:hypothetical protein